MDYSASESPDYLDILIVCAAPLDVAPALNLAQELAAFENEVRRAPIPIRLKRVFPPTFKQLERELSERVRQRFRPRVFHFLGHGEEDGLLFETEHGTHERISPARLRRVLAGEGSPIELALLNACWSGTSRVLSLCRHLTQAPSVIRSAIGHGKPVADESAIRFAQRFYEALMDGDSVGRACQRAANTLAEMGLPGFDEIELEGDRDLRLGQDLRDGERTGRTDDGLPERYFVPATGFFCGRAEEYLRIVTTLDDHQLTGFGIWGIGGIGKTALVKEVAQRNAWRYRGGGVAFVDIRDLPALERTATGLMQRALAYLDPASEAPDPASGLIRYWRQAGAGLAVFDNLEDLPEAEQEPLARFVRDIPRNGSRVLVTARTRLKAFEDLPTTGSLDLTQGLDDWNGAHYVHWTAQKKGVQALSEPLRFSAGRVEGVCARVNRALSGHPKMIEVAVGVARKGIQALDQALDGLSGPLEVQLHSLLATGLNLVGDEGRRLWACLTFFPAGHFMPEALDALVKALALAENSEGDTDGETDPPAWVEAGLEQLERAAFLDFDQDAQVYRFHQGVLDHARRNARFTDEQSDTGFLGLLVFHAQYLVANCNNFPAIDRCFRNALALMEQAWQIREQSGAPSEWDGVLAAMADSLGYYFHQRGLWKLGQEWQDRSIVLRRTTFAEHQDGLAHALYRKAMLHHDRGETAEAREALAESISLWEKVGNQKGLAASLHELARVESAQGQPSEARRLLRRSQEILETLGDQRGLAASLHELARVESAQGQPSEARRLLHRSLKIWEALGDQQGLAASLHVLAILESTQGNVSEARRLLHRSLEIDEALRDRRGLAASLHQLAMLESAQNHPSEARRLLCRSLEIWETLGDQQGLAASLHELAILESAQGNPSEARRLLRRSLEIDEALGYQRGLAASLHELANLEVRAGNHEEARRLWERSIAINKTVGNIAGRAVSLYMLAQLEALQGNTETALTMAREAVAILEKVGSAQTAQARSVLQDIEARAGGQKTS